MDLFPNFWVILLKIFFSETGSQNSFKFGMEHLYDKVIQVCSDKVDLSPDADFMDRFPNFQVFLLKSSFQKPAVGIASNLVWSFPMTRSTKFVQEKLIRTQILWTYFRVLLLKIFFSETGSQNSLKFGMQLPYDKVYQICSGKVDSDLDLDLLDHFLDNKYKKQFWDQACLTDVFILKDICRSSHILHDVLTH